MTDEFNLGLRPEFDALVPPHGAVRGHASLPHPREPLSHMALRLQQLTDQNTALEAALAATTGGGTATIPNALSELNTYQLTEITTGKSYKIGVTHSSTPSSAWYVLLFPSPNVGAVSIEIEGVSGSFPLKFNSRKIFAGMVQPDIPVVTYFDGPELITNELFRTCAPS